MFAWLVFVVALAIFKFFISLKNLLYSTFLQQSLCLDLMKMCNILFMRKINEIETVHVKKNDHFFLLIVFSYIKSCCREEGINSFFYVQVAIARSNELKLPARELNWIQGKIFSDAKAN